MRKKIKKTENELNKTNIKENGEAVPRGGGDPGFCVLLYEYGKNIA